MDLALRRTGAAVALVWRGGERARGKRRDVELQAGMPIEGTVIAHEAIVKQIAELPHGSRVTVACTYQTGRGIIATRVLDVEAYAALATPVTRPERPRAQPRYAPRATSPRSSRAAGS